MKRRFKQATGLALIDYVQNLRIEEARRLLESSDQSVDEIGFAIGYEDPSFLRRLFKRRTGVAPAPVPADPSRDGGRTRTREDQDLD